MRVGDQRHDRLTLQIDDLRGQLRVLMISGNRPNPVSLITTVLLRWAGFPVPSVSVTFASTVCCCANASAHITTANTIRTSTPSFGVRDRNILSNTYTGNFRFGLERGVIVHLSSIRDAVKRFVTESTSGVQHDEHLRVELVGP